ncbi:DNA translocase FtsK [Teredinibacter franksiae]|uniref:DNA translocase FtsK n=1 Tax=Teredinibacter franksiae TaxID=2761453 RepID=UPI001FE9AD66|nr:DNA translocase FtsK [Teredinibacter franksiae]
MSKAETSTAGQVVEKATTAARIVREGILIGLMLACAFIALALLTYSANDPGWSKTGAGGVLENAGGPAGAWLADVFFSLFGNIAYLFPLLLAYQVFVQLRDRSGVHFDVVVFLLRLIGFSLVMTAATGIAVMQYGTESALLPFSAGGYLGLTTAMAINNTFGYMGGSMLLLAILLFGLTIFVEISWFVVMDSLGGVVFRGSAWVRLRYTQWRQGAEERKKARVAVKQRRDAAKVRVEHEKKRKPPTITPPKKQKPEPSVRAQKEKQQKLQFDDTPAVGELPPVDLLDPADKKSDKGYSEDSLEAMSRLLELKLNDFGVIAEVVAVLPGPVVTRFEIQPAAGVKVSKISNLAKDLARSLAVISVRVVEVIQGKSVVGIEIPNEYREMVRLSEVINSAAFDKSKSPLSLALGHDISGQSVIADLAKMPHLLVAGTTGSGKSVGVNSMLISMLYKATPEEVRLILVDPKMLELSVYDGIPHLLAPVITDMKDAATGLRWCVGEMERRYKLMAAMGVRNLTGYNKKVRDAEKAGAPITDPLWAPEDDGVVEMDNATAPNLTTMPFIVIVIDEFADMMMIVGKKVEQLIARIAQKARAAGIHMILATQRPSVDVITGLIKANVPTRMAFQVSSKIDSRTILDQGGAEQLLGHGDMLFLPPGAGVTVRVHGAFIDDHEVHKVVADWKKRGAPDYLEEIFSEEVASIPVPGFSTDEGDGGKPESDPLYDEAIAFVTESRKASISAVQRKLRVGYNRAARLIEEMEMSGVVTEMGSNGMREVLAPPPPKR